MDSLLGRRISHYRILAHVGAGGMGTVYRARDERLGRDVALKLVSLELRSDPGARARLLREAQLASRLNHPNVAQVYDVGDDGDAVFVVFEFVEGVTLERAIPPGGMAMSALLDCAVQVAAGLAHGHEHGVVHRDLKCANVALNAEGSAKILDFGVARDLEAERNQAGSTTPELTLPGSVVGTPQHLPPEVLRGDRADTAADVWALGILLYQMASGRRPFEGESMLALASSIAADSPAPLQRVSRAFRAVVDRCLEKDPTRRYRNAGEVRSVLEGLRESRRMRMRRRGRAMAIGAVVGLVLLAAAALTWNPIAGLLSGAGRPTIRALAVLPLVNLSADPAQEYFVDGMTEELIGNVGTIPSLRVISRTSVMRYKGTRHPVSRVAAELGVDAVVEGSVRRDGDRVRITAQLIDAGDDRPLWSKSYDREFREVLVLQREIAQAIAFAVRREVAPASAGRPLHPEAYELWLQGRHAWSRMTDRDVRRSIELFEQSRSIDPLDARASCGLADAYLVLVQVLGSMPAREGMVLALDNARRAIAADSTSADAHASAAAALFFETWDRPTAWREVRRALELNPNHAHAHLVASAILGTQGRFDEAIAMDARALELDPFSVLLHWHASRSLRMAGRLDESLAIGEKGLRLDPRSASILGSMVGACEDGKRWEAALELRERAAAGDPSRQDAVGRLRAAFARDGGDGYLRAHLRQLQAQADSPEATMPLALLYCRLGESSRSLDYLERAYAEHSSDLLYLGAEPGFARLRGEPRFEALLRRMTPAS